MARFGFAIDNRQCIGCHACTVACKSEHEVPVGVNRTWVKYIEEGEFPHARRSFSVQRCNHCDDAPCIEICPVTSLFRRPDGIVDFDPLRCIGCKSCMQACPYDAIYIDPATHTAAKCNYCAHRVERGYEPACVVVCPTNAIVAGDLDNEESRLARLQRTQPVQFPKPEKGTRPKLFYIDGDAAALDPAQAPPAEDYLWSAGGNGVLAVDLIRA
ncbi:MAG: 4Fe-4S dicluster domain-containing protein, partial [Planctomycetota bacterium]